MSHGVGLSNYDGYYHQLLLESPTHDLPTVELHDFHLIYGHFHIYHVLWLLHFSSISQDDAAWKYVSCFIYDEIGGAVSVCHGIHLD